MLIRETQITDTAIKILSRTVSITDLKIAFTVELTVKSEPNKATIQVWNMNPDNRALLEKGSDEQDSKSVVNLSAGNSETLKELFNGNVQRSETKREGPNHITTIEVGDGDFVFRKAKHSKAYKGGTPYTLIVRDIASSMGLLPPLDLDLLGSSKINVATTYSGLARTALDNIMEKLELDWSIQAGVLKLVEVGEPDKEQIVLLTPKTGLIGKPATTDKGIQIKSLLQGEFAPNGRVKLQDTNPSGVFLINKVIHRGDNRGQDWYSNLTGTPSK